jgi:hypothetical protein
MLPPQQLPHCKSRSPAYASQSVAQTHTKVKPTGQNNCTQQWQFGGSNRSPYIKWHRSEMHTGVCSCSSFGLEQVLNPNEDSKIMQENTARKYLGEREPAGHDEPNRSKFSGCSASARQSITDLKSLLRMECLFMLALRFGPAAGSARARSRPYGNESSPADQTGKRIPTPKILALGRCRPPQFRWTTRLTRVFNSKHNVVLLYSGEEDEPA